MSKHKSKTVQTTINWSNRARSRWKAEWVTGNEVDVAGDLKNATVYLGLLGTTEQKKTALDLLQKNRARIQSLVAKTVVLKYTPKLRFAVDESVDRGNRVLQIIEELEKTLPKE
jgi:ribosome-binding factor A